ncbi:MAG: hypothetical protein ACKVOI_18560 [Dongiaceae bacterium]
MKKLGICLGLLGGVLKMIGPGQLNLIGDGAAQIPGMGATGIGLVPIAILAASGCGFIGGGRLAGITLMLVSIYGFFFDGGLLIALPFFGSLMIIAGSGRTSAYRGG